MKRLLKSVMMWGAMMAGCFMASAQKVDDQRMERDIEVAENVLNTLLRQKFSGQRFFGFNVTGNYTAGYGVTFRMPSRGIYNVMSMDSRSGGTVYVNGAYTYTTRSGEDRATEERRAAEKTPEAQSRSTTKTKTTLISKKVDRDSLMASTEQIFLTVAKDFLADYGDMISQLKPDERIVITNRSEDFDGNFYMKWPGGDSRRSLISAEAHKDDITQLKTGKITRDQFLSKLKIVNTEASEDLDPDLEVLSSMFSRLYQDDLSKTYYVQGGLSYERLKDFGVIYYMKVYSSNEENDSRFYMPTVGLRDATQAERDKKVKELYPAFESGLKENIIDYARTLRSLKDEEVVTFKVKMTKCAGCGIPETVEMTIKNSALKDYASGKANKEATLAKINVKKIGEQ